MPIASSSRWKILLALLLLSLTAVLQIGHPSIYHTSINESSRVIQAAELSCLSADSTYWAMRYTIGWSATEVGRSIAETNDGRIVMAGTDGAANFWLTKIDRDGTALWQRSYGGGSDDYLYAVAQTRDNGFILIGESDSFPDIWILKLDSMGNILWQKSYEGSSVNRGLSIQQTSDGGYIAVGYRRDSPNDEDFLILRLDANGNLTWNRKFGGDLPDPAHAIRETLDGGFIVAGRSDSLFARAGSAWVIKLDADGSIVWQKLYGRSWNEVNSVELASGGGYLLAGSSLGQSGWLLRLYPDGEMLWEKKYTTVEMNSELNEIKPTSDGGYIAVGTLWDDHSDNFDIWLLKVDAAGDVGWSRKYDASVADFGYSVVQLGDGGFALSGSVLSLGSTSSRDALILRLNQAGNIPNCPVDSDNPVVVEPDGVSEDDSSVSDDVYQLTVHDSNSSPVNTKTRPDPICGELSERLNINYETGAPGSYFTLTGLYFPAESVIEISVNGLNLGSVNSDANGDLVFLILTPGADEGGYVVKAQAGMEMATSIFRLDNSQPLRPQEGDGVVFNVPPGISLTRRGLLPTIISD